MADAGLAPITDEVDLALIALLEQDGRASFTELGSKLGISSEVARLRYLRLTNNGLLSVVGLVNPATAGLTTVANINFRVHGRLDEVTAALVRRPEMTFVAWNLGGFNVVGEIACDSRPTMVRVVYDELAQLPGVVEVEVLEFMRVYRFETSTRPAPMSSATAPLPPAVTAAIPNDELTSGLVRLLHEDGRRPFTELADELGRPYSVVRRRCQALLQHGVVQIAVVIDRMRFQRELMGSLWLRASGDIDRALTEIAAMPRVQIVVRTSGPRQAVVEATAPDAAHLAQLADDVCRVEGVLDATLGVYTDIKKLPSQWLFDPV